MNEAQVAIKSKCYATVERCSNFYLQVKWSQMDSNGALYSPMATEVNSRGVGLKSDECRTEGSV